MEYYFAPMEGITGAEFRAIHHQFFPGVDKYYLPFLSPTHDRVFTPRDLRNVVPERNRDIAAVPQLLTRDPDDFLWAAGELAAMGYDEVNLNLGCPSGTVTAKGKGAGMLADPQALDRFLDKVYDKAPVAVTLKTRLGMKSPDELPALLEVFARYPVPLLILHPRVREDFYREPVRLAYFARAAETYPGPLCYNGGLTCPEDCAALSARFPDIHRLMLGQGLLADPTLVTRMKGGPGPERETLRAFHEALYHTYLDLFQSQRNTVFHMKELWSYLRRLFVGGDKLFKQIRKAQGSAEYDAAVEMIFRTLPLRDVAEWEGKAEFWELGVRR